MSHPAWVCGLKQVRLPAGQAQGVTPCVGVWIETSLGEWETGANVVTPCVGVWIETNVQAAPVGPLIVTPCVGVWIETSNSVQTGWPISSHPAWVYMD